MIPTCTYVYICIYIYIYVEIKNIYIYMYIFIYTIERRERYRNEYINDGKQNNDLTMRLENTQSEETNKYIRYELNTTQSTNKTICR